MTKKISLTIFFFTLVATISSYAQVVNLKLPKPAKDFYSSRNKSEEIIYSYLKTYFKENGKPNIGCLNFKDTSVTCHWCQVFSNAIIYDIDSCYIDRKTNKIDYVVNVVFPNVKNNELIALVESLFQSENMIWSDSGKTLYISQDYLIGFTCEIKKENNNFVLRICSRC